MGIMGGRNKISNIEIDDNNLSYLIKENFDIEPVKKILRVVKGKSVHRIITENNTSYRLDVCSRKIGWRYKKRMHYQDIVYKNGVNVPKVIDHYENQETFLKLSEWIHGVRVGGVWDNPKMFRNAGIQIAKINNIKDSFTGLFLGYNDFSQPNAIWTPKEQVYLVDVVILPKKNVDESTTKFLVQKIKDKEKIGWFLEGYSKIRKCGVIINYLEKRGLV